MSVNMAQPLTYISQSSDFALYLEGSMMDDHQTFG